MARIDLVETNDSSGVFPSLPVGMVLGFCGINCPEGFLFCDGKEYSSALYPRLSEFLNGDTTFKVPDMREAVPVKNGVNTTFESQGGTIDELGSFVEGDDLEHTGGYGWSFPNDVLLNHDVFNVGEFKDDCLQNHEHRHLYNPSWGNSRSAYRETNYIEYFYGTRSGGYNIKTNGIVTCTDNELPNLNQLRVGKVTRGITTGINFIIKY